MIYIDPPYNTGNDGFKYNDKFNHSTWLTFMKNRLEIAKILLADDGVIFVSLDDKEAHYCKILMDEIFGRENFIADICHKSRASISNDKIISPNHNHILFFAKNERIVHSNRHNFGVGKDLSTFKEKDENGYYKLVPVDGPGGEKKGNPYYEFLGITNYWRFSKETMQEMYDNGLIVKKKNSLLQKYYKSKAEGSKQTITTWWDEGLLTSNASSDLNKMFKENLFNNPKNESLMELIIEITTNESDIVLDFHLGSGTTAAVAHKMNRQYIGIEQMDYIETLAVERLKKVIKGEQGGISKAVNWQGGGEFVYAELAPFNETAKQQILACENLGDIKTLFNELYERYFLKYNVSVDEFSQMINEPEFQALPLDEQKQMVLEMLDLNQMYVSLSEMDDEQFAGCLNDDDKALSRAFYQSVKNQAEKKDGE
nr:site-specific DNA-methyltransferase [Haemophilus influenzae]